MSTITAISIIDRAWIVVQDTVGTAGVRWPKEEMLNWVNDAQREIVLLHPAASITIATPTILPGTRQSLFALGLLDGIRIIDVVRNIAADGLTPGRAIRIVTREILDAQRPGWHSETGTEIVHWMYDPRDTKSLYVYPALNPLGAKVELIYSSSPVTLTTSAELISVDDVYANCLLNYVLFRAYSKDSEYAQNVQLSAAYYQLFMSALNAKTQLDGAERPVVPAT